MTTARRKAPINLSLALALVASVLVLSPALADTEDELADAKSDLAAIQDDLDEATYEWNQAMSRLDQTRDDITLVKARIRDLEARLDRVDARLEKRAALAYTIGPASTIEALLSSSTFSEFSDRLEFLGSVTQADVDLALEREVAQEELRREQDDLAALSERQAETAEQLEEVTQDIDSKFEAVNARVAELTEKLRKEQAAQRALELIGQNPGGTPTSSPGSVPVPGGSGAIQVCPVAGPNSFVDSFGWPRVGHTHQGIDLIAPAGTPIVATHAGAVSQSSSSSGGLQAYVRAGDGTYTFYAHLSGYAATGSVGAGTVIGYVGSTGNAGDTNHLHFELHPGGGAAVNPYSLLVAVC